MRFVARPPLAPAAAAAAGRFWLAFFASAAFWAFSFARSRYFMRKRVLKDPEPVAPVLELRPAALPLRLCDFSSREFSASITGWKLSSGFSIWCLESFRVASLRC